MKRRLVPFALFIALLTCAALVPGVAAAGRSSVEDEVWSVVRAWNRAFAANDAPAYFERVDPAISVFTPSNPYRIEGIQADREEFEFGLRQGYGKVGYFQELQPKIEVIGDVALVTYHSRGRYGADDKAGIVYLKETDVLVRRDGRWRLLHIHTSATPSQ